MHALYELLHANEALLLFLVIGFGYLLGQIRIGSFSLGIAGVLFVGLAFGAWRPTGDDGQPLPALAVHPMIREIGLILFVYAVGLTSGPGFFTALRKNGIRFNIAVGGALILSAAIAIIAGHLLGVRPGLAAGAFCGGLTNTPALAAVTEYMRAIGGETASMDPTLGYSLTYPFGVLGPLLAFQAFTLITRQRFEAEKAANRAALEGEAKVTTANFEITNPALFERAIGELEVQTRTGLVLSRIRHAGTVSVPSKYTVLHEGDVVVAVGKKRDIEAAASYFGKPSSEHLELNREHIEMRRILVSHKDLAGKSIEELELDRRFNAQVTRVRRADLDIVAHQGLRLELGDRLRVVMPRDRVAEVSRFFGDSEKHVAELDYTAITLGISLGVLVGMIPIPIPGGSPVRLGFAGGPLVVALLLGYIGRTGPVVWSIPLEANLALRHIGLLFFLAGVGVTSGSKFASAFAESGVQIMTLGVLITGLTTFLSLLFLRLAGASVTSSLGATSGTGTQPASLANSYELAKSDEVYTSYATVYPVAMVGKIILAQVVVIVGNMLGGGGS